MPFAVPLVFRISCSCGSREPRKTSRAFTVLCIFPSEPMVSCHCNTHGLDIAFVVISLFRTALQALCWIQLFNSFLIATSTSDQ